MFPGQELDTAERRRLAKKISDDLWNIYTTKIKVGKVFTQGQEALFVQSPVPSALFNSSLKTMYIKGQESSNHFRVLQAANTQVVKFLNTRSIMDPTRVFFNKNPEYFRRRDELEQGLKADYAKTGLAEQHTAKQRNKWFENQRKRRPEFKSLGAEFSQNTGGAVAGHVFGGPVTLASGLFESRNDVFEKDLHDIQITSNIPAELRPTLKKLVLDVISADAKVNYKRTLGTDKVLGLVTITVPELDIKNATEGKAVQAKLKKLKAWLVANRQKVYSMQGSPSYEMLIRELIENTFLGKKTSPRSFTTSKTIKNKRRKVSVELNNIKGSRVKTRPTTKNRSQNRSANAGDLKDLIALINAKLHDKIRENMGKGNSRTTLNYRTGRFARSAKVLDLKSSTEKNAIVANVEYMRRPYGVFEKGGRLNPPAGRDPKRIFGRSIRQILQEEKIASLRRVKVNLRG
jgi:hypothetical protein